MELRMNKRLEHIYQVDINSPQKKLTAANEARGEVVNRTPEKAVYFNHLVFHLFQEKRNYKQPHAPGPRGSGFTAVQACFLLQILGV